MSIPDDFTVEPITLPFTPTATLHRLGGKVTKIVGFGHMLGKGAGGRSTDWWFIRGSIAWDTQRVTNEATIDPSELAYEDEVGRMEIGRVSAALMDYLRANGTWTDGGWVAHRAGNTQ